jgi:hypothetical protein
MLPLAAPPLAINLNITLSDCFLFTRIYPVGIFNFAIGAVIADFHFIPVVSDLQIVNFSLDSLPSTNLIEFSLISAI